jgi:hypothetical protein
MHAILRLGWTRLCPGPDVAAYQRRFAKPFGRIVEQLFGHRPMHRPQLVLVGKQTVQHATHRMQHATQHASHRMQRTTFDNARTHTHTHLVVVVGEIAQDTQARPLGPLCDHCSPGADVAGVSPITIQTWQWCAKSRCRRGRQSRGARCDTSKCGPFSSSCPCGERQTRQFRCSELLLLRGYCA